MSLCASPACRAGICHPTDIFPGGCYYCKTCCVGKTVGSSKGGQFLSRYLDKPAGTMDDAVAGLFFFFFLSFFPVSRRTSSHRAEVSAAF